MAKAPKNVSTSESGQVGVRSHVKQTYHSERGETNSPHEKGELNQVKGHVSVQNNKEMKYRK